MGEIGDVGEISIKNLGPITNFMFECQASHHEQPRGITRSPVIVGDVRHYDSVGTRHRATLIDTRIST